MKKAWKIVLILALCIFILGEVVLGVGLLSGGSPERVWKTVSEKTKVVGIVETYNEIAGEVQDFVQAFCDKQNYGVDVIIPTIPLPTAARRSLKRNTSRSAGRRFCTS